MYFTGHYGEDNRAETSNSRPSEGPDESRPEFDGYDCTLDCSGHEAGYKWAEEHSITDGGDCDAAGEHSNSPSFAEGCHAYVDGDDPAPNNNDDADKNDRDPDEEN